MKVIHPTSYQVTQSNNTPPFLRPTYLVTPAPLCPFLLPEPSFKLARKPRIIVEGGGKSASDEPGARGHKSHVEIKGGQLVNARRKQQFMKDKTDNHFASKNNERKETKKRVG